LLLASRRSVMALFLSKRCAGMAVRPLSEISSVSSVFMATNSVPTKEAILFEDMSRRFRLTRELKVPSST